MKLPAIHTLSESLRFTLRRFPVPAACVLLFAIVALINVRGSQRQLFALPASMLYFLFCACFGFIAAKLVIESSKIKPHKVYGISIVAAGFLALLFQTEANLYQMMTLSAVCVLLMFVAPYLTRTADNDHMWTFCFRLSTRIAFTVVAAIVLYLGAVLVMSSFQYLIIGTMREGNIYFYLWIVVAALFSPMLAMAGIPRKFDEAEDSYPKYLRMLLTYIVMPLWVVYIALLYVYMLKILFTLTLPKGNVAYIVSGFGAVTIGVYLKAYPLFKRGTTHGVAKFFHKNAFNLLLPPLALLALAIFMRVDAYGITEERYMVLLALLWLVSCVAIQKRNDALAPRRILLSAVVLLLFSSCGPWGMNSLSTSSQRARLEEVLTRSGILRDGVIVKSDAQISSDDVIAISDGIDYFISSNKKYVFQDWLGTHPDRPLECKANCDSSYGSSENTKRNIAHAMGISYINKWSRDVKGDTNLTHSFYINNKQKLLAISGYDYIIPLQLPDYDKRNNNDGYGWHLEIADIKSASGEALQFRFVCEQDALVCYVEGSSPSDRIIFRNDALLASYKWKNGEPLTSSEHIKVNTGENSTFKVSLHISYINGTIKNDDANTAKLNSIGGYLLIDVLK